MINGKWLFLLSAVISSWVSVQENSTASEEYKYYPKMAATLYSGKEKGDELAITAPTEHGYEFLIRRPDETFLFLYLKPSDLMPNTVQGFGKAGTMNLNTRTITGFKYEDGQPIEMLIFNQPGRYCLHFSSNFDTHPVDTYYSIIDIQWPSPTNIQKGLNNGECLEEFREELRRDARENW